MSTTLRWGILGAGRIAHAFAKGVLRSKTGKLVAVGSRSLDNAQAWAKDYDNLTTHGSYEALLADEKVDAVYIATPHPMHAQWVIRAAEAGKHILCEKPIGVNAAQAMAMVEAARVHNVFLMEAFMYRCHPQTQRLVELIREKAIGEVRLIHASFGFHAGFDADARLFNNDLAGGGILDVGCYAVSMSRLIAGAAQGKPFANPIEVKGSGHLGRTGVDEWAAATLRFEGDILAQVSTSVSLNQENKVRIYGSEGHIEVLSPWFCSGREGGSSKILVHRKGNQTEEITIETDQWLYSIEADAVAQYLDQREASSPAMSLDDTQGNMVTLDRWRESIGLLYDREKPERVPQPIHGRALKRSDSHKMPYGSIPGLDKQVARLVMGCDNQRFMPHAAIMWDDYVERGGNCFDTSYIYAGGIPEKLLGHWMKARGNRKDMVLIGKGAHTPNCYPDKLTAQLLETLERFQSDHVDIYIMHRDNLDVPVGEFVDVLNEHCSAGRVKVFGGSNWSIQRIEEANAYAKQHGKQGFTVLSNNFSLARMVDPVWAGCIAASDPDSRAWLEKTQMPLMPWSSQARGFFTDRAGPDKTDDAELVRCWYSEDNFQRRERAIELANRKGVEPINIALAYVLCQPFPTFALIGPRQLSETRSSFRSLDFELTPEEIKWLNLEA